MTETVEMVVRQVLIEHGVDVVDNQGLHGWRCQYPDSYGACSCFDDLVVEMVDRLAKREEADA